jgi:hypothetical protein
MKDKIIQESKLNINNDQLGKLYELSRELSGEKLVRADDLTCYFLFAPLK